MRDLLVTLIFAVSLPLILMRPHVGVLVWSWFGYMNPHRLAWGFAYNFPFSKIIAGTVLVSILLSSEPKRFPITPLTVLWVLFIGWMCVTTFYAMYPEDAQELLSKILKIQLMVFVTVLLMQSRERLDQLIWIIVASLGFFGVKGGLFKLLTGGSALLYGPGGFIQDNNALAIALLMILPLFNYLRLTSPKRWMRWILMICILATAVAIIGTFSRAAALGGIAMAFMLWLKSQHKAATAMAVLVLLPMLYFTAPQSWHDRMTTITTVDETGEREVSAQSRLDVWAMIFNLAKDRPVMGAGLQPWNMATYERYAPDPERIKKAWAAHSIYLSVLAEHGFVGLGLLLAIFALVLRGLRRVIRECSGIAEAVWLVQLARMLLVSFVGFLVAGAFHQLPYFDLPWHIVAMVAICQVLAARYREAVEPATSKNRQPASSAPGQAVAAGS